MTIKEELSKFIPARFFVNDLKENKIGHIKLAFVRETINPLIIRSTDSEATIIMISNDGRELVEIPPRKLKSREKLLGLMICREFNLVNEEVHYNSIFKSEHLANPNSVLFGDSVTQSQDAASLPSRAVYDWAYSLRDVKDITDKLQHNSISEDGTILKDKDFNPKQEDGTKVASQALHQTEYVLPGTYFPHFITIDNVTPELLLHLLSCVINQHRYGAQITTNANNMNNHLVAIGFGDFEKPINSYTVSKAWNNPSLPNGQNDSDNLGIQIPTLDNVKNFIQTQMEIEYKNNILNSKSSNSKTNGDSKTVIDLIDWLNGLWEEFDLARNKEEDKKETLLYKAYEQAQKDVTKYLKEIKMISDKAKKAPKGKQNSAEKDNIQPIEQGNENEDSTN